MLLELRYLSKTVALVGGKVIAGAPGSHTQPERLTTDVLLRIAEVAPLHLDELAALICGTTPFDIEPFDDKACIRDWERVYAKLREAARQGSIGRRPTLREGVVWALEVGCPMANRAQLLRAAGVADSAVATRIESIELTPQSGEVKRDWQTLAREISDEIYAKEGLRPKREYLAHEIKKRLGLKQSASTIERRIRAVY